MGFLKAETLFFMTISPKKLHTFSRKEITWILQQNAVKKYNTGLKSIQFPIPPVSENLPAGVPLPTHGKLLIITSRKSGKAADRNRIRRRLKAFFYQEKLYTQLLYTVIFVHPFAMKLTAQELRTYLLKLYHPAGQEAA